MNDLSKLITRKFESILAHSDIPKEITFHDSKVLKIKTFQKHFAIYFMETKLMFRIVLDKNKNFLEFRNEYNDCLLNRRIEEQENGWLRVSLESIDKLDEYSLDIRQIFKYEFNLIHGEAFGCCSSYAACSDVRKCINSDFIFSLSCYYRINLLNNNIFYGANRNN